MRLIRAFALLLLTFPSLRLHAADKPGSALVTFYVSGVECGSCVYMVQHAVSEIKGVRDIELVQVFDNYANVSFDPRQVSEHQIAQAVRDAIPLHGTPYLATLRVLIPDYTSAGNPARVDALFARWKEWIEVELLDRPSGHFAIHFKPLQGAKDAKAPLGWSLAEFKTAMSAPAPQGLGLPFKLEEEGR